MGNLSKVVSVDKEKCINCHKCIAVCPVKFCNDASGDYVEINDEMCIGCGSCITECSHDARNGVDDFSEFLKAISRKEKIVAIAAPAVASNFPDNYLKINGWLKTLGVDAVLFSTPGGLLRTAERVIPEIREKTRKIEGVHTVYSYFEKLNEMIKMDRSPLLVDCLNCEMGCNGGTGTLNSEKSTNEIEYLIEKRNKEMQEKYRDRGVIGKIINKKTIDSVVDKYWEDGVYDRSYVNRSSNNYIKEPDIYNRKKIMEKMAKFSERDMYNCSACGYGTCDKMITAIHNNLNKPENCYHYNQYMVDMEREELEKEKNVAIEKSIEMEGMKKTIAKENENNIEICKRVI